jgi:hypothetical protein
MNLLTQENRGEGSLPYHTNMQYRYLDTYTSDGKHSSYELLLLLLLFKVKT